MSDPRATIEIANRVLLVEGEGDAAETFFVDDYLARVTDGDLTGRPAAGRRLRRRHMIVSRFSEGRIAEDWVMTDLAERLLRRRG